MRRSRLTRHCRLPFERRDLVRTISLMEVLQKGLSERVLKAGRQVTGPIAVSTSLLHSPLPRSILVSVNNDAFCKLIGAFC
jgi:hypothetical protein